VERGRRSSRVRGFCLDRLTLCALCKQRRWCEKRWGTPICEVQGYHAHSTDELYMTIDTMRDPHPHLIRSWPMNTSTPQLSSAPTLSSPKSPRRNRPASHPPTPSAAWPHPSPPSSSRASAAPAHTLRLAWTNRNTDRPLTQNQYRTRGRLEVCFENFTKIRPAFLP
jgi:hypothetical protein